MTRRRALSLASATLVLFVGCQRDAVGSRAAKLGIDCGSAAEVFFALRAMAGDYPRAEADKRTMATQEGLKRCAEASPRTGCCEEAKKIRDRIGGKGLVALCDPFFVALADDGCAELR
jgi:hypothetical protein